MKSGLLTISIQNPSARPYVVLFLCPLKIEKFDRSWVIRSGRFLARLLKLCEPEQMAQVPALWYIQKRCKCVDFLASLRAVQKSRRTANVCF